MHLDEKIDFYLKERFGPAAALKSRQRTGKGIHGTGYLLTYAMPEGEKQVIMKSLSPSGFGHDHFSDRAQVLLLASANYNRIERHIKAIDVVGETPDRFISLKDAREFHLFMDKAAGTSYFKDLDDILARGSLNYRDKEKAQALARFAAGLNRTKYTGEHGKTLYRRRIRDLIGHGECIMGVIDAYNGSEFASDKELVEYAKKSLNWWARIRDRMDRLCEVHGDFHPGNIRFSGKDFILLDRSRGTWGEIADDVACLGINYIYYAIRDRKIFNGPFAELYHIFTETYVEETGDYGFFEVAPPFYAFRVLVIAHPSFYPDDTTLTRRMLLNFGHSVLEDDKLRMDRINVYLQRSLFKVPEVSEVPKER